MLQASSAHVPLMFAGLGVIAAMGIMTYAILRCSNRASPAGHAAPGRR
jgi:hypothetical protein